jgi:hypothetical protein
LRTHSGTPSPHLLQAGDDEVDVVERDHHDAIGVADHHVAGRHRGSREHDGQVDGAGPVLHRRVRRDARREARQADVADAGDVAHAAIRDESDGAEIARHAEHEIADDRRLAIAVRRGDDDVRRLDERQRGEDGEVVGGPGMTRHRHAAELRLLRHHGFHVGRKSGAAVQGIDDESRRSAAQGIELRRAGAGHATPELDQRRIVDHGATRLRRAEASVVSEAQSTRYMTSD